VVLAPVGQSYHRSTGGDFHHSDMNCDIKPSPNSAILGETASHRPSAGGGAAAPETLKVALEQTPSRQHQLQASALSSTVASELNLRSMQQNPISDVTYVANQLREDMMRTLVGNDLSLTGSAPWLEDPVFRDAVARHIALLRFNQSSGFPPIEHRLPPAPKLNPPPHSSPSSAQSSPDVRVTSFVPAPAASEQTPHPSLTPRKRETSSTRKSKPVDKPSSAQTTHAIKATHASGGGGTDKHASDDESESVVARKDKLKTKSVPRQDPQALSNLERCPRCGTYNHKLRGDPVVHYMMCKNTQKGFTPTTDELVALSNLESLKRRMKGVTERSRDTDREVREERKARKAGTVPIKDESEVSASSEDGVERNRDGYEDDPGSDDSSPSTSSVSNYGDSSSSSTSSDEPPPKPKTKVPKSAHAKAAPRPLQPEPSVEMQQMRKQLDDFQHQSQDMHSCIKAIYGELKSIKETSAKPPVYVVESSPTASALQSPSTMISVRGGAAHSRAHTTSHNSVPATSGYAHSDADIGDQAFPEIEDKDLAIIGSFEKHKKAYKEYVSKCKDRQRTPVSMAATFVKWGQWLAVVFTEQDKQQSEAEGRGTWNQYEKSDVLAMPNHIFEAKYTEMCGLAMQEPSSVLDYLRRVEVDVSDATMPQLLMAAESFRNKIKQVPAKVFHATTQDRIRNAFLESIFGEDRGKRKRVDYDHLEDWDQVVQHFVRVAARSTTGKAFETFKSLITKKKGKGDKEDKDGDSDGEHSGGQKKPKDFKDDPLCEGVDMRILSERKWYKRYRYLAHQNKRDLENHGNSNSWKTRYVYLSDSIDKKSQRCARCKVRGHVGSVCKDPLPEILWPTHSEEPNRGRDHSRERESERGERGERGGFRSRGDYRRSFSREPSERDRSRDRDYEHRREYDQRGDDRQDRGQYHQRRDESRDRGQYGQRREESRDRGQYRDRSPYQRKDEERRDDSGVRGLNHERGQGAYRRSPSPGSIECYRCHRKGHKSNDCTHDTFPDGKPIPNRAASPGPRAGGGAASNRGGSA